MVAIVAGALLATLLLVWVADDGDSPSSTTSSTQASSTTGSTSSVPSTSTTVRPGTITVDEASEVVWPDPEGFRRFGDPAQAVRSFAVDLVGFTAPLLGTFRQGDTRSGEIEVRSRAAGPATTVLTRQLSDGSWWVLGAVTGNIDLDDPIAGTAIDHPLRLVGRASAFEGTVQVSVFRRGSTTPLGEGFVTGSSGPELGPFDGFVSWANPGGGWGSVVLYTASAEDGTVEQAVAIPVGFIGGD